MKNITNDASTPAIVIQNNPHQTPKIAPAASANIDSGNMNVVPIMKRTIKRTGPKNPRAAIKLSTFGM